MKTHFLIAAALLGATQLAAETKPAAVLAPGEIVAASPKADWVGIAASDLLVMDLAPDAKGKARRVVIQLMPPPFSAGWIGNIRKLAAAHWWDGLSVNRVQDNYVAQWGDADGDDKMKARALPSGLETVPESAYTFDASAPSKVLEAAFVRRMIEMERIVREKAPKFKGSRKKYPTVGFISTPIEDSYARSVMHWHGWPIGIEAKSAWPTHCYGMVGVGRDLPPNTGSGTDLYTVIGHAPRHLDRNIALVGRVIEGIDNLSSLPRGTGALGFYEHAEERVPIVSVRLGNEAAGLAGYEYLSTESSSFAKYADARANRRDPFFIRPAGGADVCNIPVPVRRVK